MMRFGLAALFVATLSTVTAYPSKEITLGLNKYRRAEDSSAYGQAEGLHPKINPNNQALGDISAFSGGFTTSQNIRPDNALSSIRASSISSGPPLEMGDITTINGMSALSPDKALGDTLALNVGDVPNNQPVGDTISWNKASDLEDQETAVDDALSSAFTPPDWCSPFYQQAAKLRARDSCKMIINEPGKESGAFAIPRSRTPLKVQIFPVGSKLYEGGDDECWRATLGLLPLGVCDSTEPFKEFVSLYHWETFSFFRLVDAKLGMLLPFPGDNDITCLIFYSWRSSLYHSKPKMVLLHLRFGKERSRYMSNAGNFTKEYTMKSMMGALLCSDAIQSPELTTVEQQTSLASVNHHVHPLRSVLWLAIDIVTCIPSNNRTTKELPHVLPKYHTSQNVL